MQNSDNPMVDMEMQQCIQNCLNCYAVCMNMVNGGQQAKSPYTTKTCAQVCNHCAGECESRGDMDCANACRNCAWSCEQLAKLVP